MALLEQLFNEGNILSRSVALQRMLDLTVVSKTPLQRPQIYDEVDDFYIHVLQDAEQPDGVRTLAASRIKTYLEKTDSYAAVEIAFANAITKELRRPFLNSTYMLSLLRTLEEIRVPRELEGQKIPIVYCSLTGLMSNRDIDIDLVVRCAAARVMGRMGWDERLQFDALALATAELVMEPRYCSMHPITGTTPGGLVADGHFTRPFIIRMRKKRPAHSRFFRRGISIVIPIPKWYRELIKTASPSWPS